MTVHSNVRLAPQNQFVQAEASRIGAIFYEGLAGSSRARSYPRSYPRSYQRSTRSARSVFHRLGSPTDSLNGKASASSYARSSSHRPSACCRLFDDMQGIADARVGLETGGPEVVERTENVVVVAGRERELQERRIRDLAGRAPPEETALEQVLLASPSGRRNLRRRPNGSLVLEQSLQHADRGVE